MPLAPGYHVFADQRALGGIPRAFDVVSNALFLVVGIWGLLFLWQPRPRSSFATEQERLPYGLFFAGVGLTGIGSAYYHFQPGDARLPWDLLPMTMSFMSLLAATIMERISLKAGLRFFCQPSSSVDSQAWCTGNFGATTDFTCSRSIFRQSPSEG